MYEQYKLKNQLKVLLVPQRDTQSTTFFVMYPVGSRYETERLRGASHYIEHLMFKGTEKRKNTLILTREIDRLGAEYNAFTGKEYTGYYIKVDSQYSKIAIDILDDMLHHSKFDPKEMEREKTVIVEELNMYKDNPVMSIDNIFEELLFAGSPLGVDIGGTPKHVLSYKRDEVLSYKKKYYQPKNATLVIAGKIDEKTKMWIEEFFGTAKNAQPISNKFLPAKFGSTEKSKRIVVQEKVTDQAQFMMGFPSFAREDKRNYAVAVMNTILGGSMSSRLFIQVRERMGLAYTVRSGDEYYRDAGYNFIRAGLDAKNINKAIVVIKKEIEKLVKKGVTTRELKDAKTHIRGSLTLSMEDSSSQANWYARTAVLFSKIETPEDVLKKFDAVTQDEIKKVAAQIFDWDKVRIAIIGNIKKENVIF